MRRDIKEVSIDDVDMILHSMIDHPIINISISNEEEQKTQFSKSESFRSNSPIYKSESFKSNA